VMLIRTADQSKVAATVATSDDTIALRLRDPLEPCTSYTFCVNEGIIADNGANLTPYAISFTTAGTPDTGIRFEKVPLPTAKDFGSGFTCLKIGPDAKLYASTDDGRILRFTIHDDGTLWRPQVIASLQTAQGGRRLITGFCFDRASTP